ncbi:MAG: PD-(D/E)XK nuclease family protein [Planctomycetes bacterium]|nr:PD-(D/E)XK nuclease family protein [Planctomycetota bacterium]
MESTLPRRLPSALTNLHVRERYSPSRLAHQRVCALNVYHALAPDEQLPPGAPAFLGTLLHRVVQQLWSKPPLEARLDDHVAQLFDDLQKSAVELLCRRHPESGLGSKKVVPGSKRKLDMLTSWADTRRQDLERAWARLANRTTPTVPGPVESRSPRRFGPEVPLVAPLAGLEGEADEIRPCPGDVVEIVDFKSGRAGVAEEDGEPNEELDAARLQLWAYALAFEEMFGRSSRLRLAIEGAARTSVPWGDKERGHVLDYLAAERNRLPLGSSLPVEGRTDITVGDHCHGCGVRHRCAMYRAAAPHTWPSASEIDPALKGLGRVYRRRRYDVWGTLAALVAGPGNTQTVTITRGPDRFKIFGLSTRHGLATTHIGEAVWVFGLVSAERHGLNGRFSFPKNFREELPPGADGEAAWALTVFTGQGSSEPQSDRLDRTLIRVLEVIPAAGGDPVLRVEIVGYDKSEVTVRRSQLGLSPSVVISQGARLVGKVSLLASPGDLRFRELELLRTPSDEVIRLFKEGR